MSCDLFADFDGCDLVSCDVGLTSQIDALSKELGERTFCCGEAYLEGFVHFWTRMRSPVMDVVMDVVIDDVMEDVIEDVISSTVRPCMP
jgi:hypothetical protein